MKIRKPAFIIILISFFLPFTTSAYGSGFGIFTQGASPLGQAAAVIAHTGGPSSIFYNPALINDLPKTQVEIGTTFISPVWQYTSSQTGQTASTASSVFFPSTLYCTQAINQKISIGIGAFSPFGLGTKWDETWEGRYLATTSEMETYAINPVLSYRLTPRISVAAGIDFLWLDTTLKNKINTAALTSLPLADTDQNFSGDGTGIGYNLGILVNFSDFCSFGASYRSDIKVNISGQVVFDLPAPSLSSLFPNTGGTSTLTLPQQVFAGFSFKPAPGLILEAGVRWEDWSSYNNVRIDFNQPVLSQQYVVYKKDWHDTYAVNIGVKYTLNETVTLLGGYLYGKNPVPDSTFEPSIPDADTHLFCIGTELEYSSFTLALSYAYQLQEGRTKNNDVQDPFGSSATGKYEAGSHLLSIGLTYRF